MNKPKRRYQRLSLELLEDRTVLSGPQAIAVTEITKPTPGPMQVAIDFNEALQVTPAQDTANYKIASPGGIGLPIQSAVYSDNGTQHRVVLTVAVGTAVSPDVYHVSIDAANLSATNGDHGAPNVDQLWVDVTSTNTLEPIKVQPDGSFAVSGKGVFMGYTPPEQVLPGNFAGGHDADLVVMTNPIEPFANTGRSQLLLLKSNGDGTYAAPAPIWTAAPNQDLGSMVSVDWNHDGKLDLVVGATDWTGSDPSGNTYYVLLNDGNGNFTNAPITPIQVTSSGIRTTPFGVYDLKGDGQYEIVHRGAPNNGDSILEVIGKDPNFGYTPQMELPWNGEGPAEILFADLNGDGKPDIITRDLGYYGDADNFTVILSTPSGYAPGVPYQDTIDGGFNPKAVGIGNFSGSGHIDIASLFVLTPANGNGSDIIISENDGKGNFTEQQPIHLAYGDSNTTEATFGDVNDDGIPDLVMTTTVNGHIEVWTLLADGHGGFHPTTPAPIPLDTTDDSAPFSMALTDLDGDGFPDLVLDSFSSGQVRIAINDGTGTMRPPVTALVDIGSLPDAGSAYATFTQQQQVFADFTNDGGFGFATTALGGVDVYLAQSDGTFKQTAFLGVPPPEGESGAIPLYLTVGDLNNDGIPDIVAGNAVYLGNGDGTFRQAPTFTFTAGGLPSQGGYSIKNITLADVNHDGNLDAVAALVGPGAYNYSRSFGVLFGDGKGDLSFNANTVVPGYFNNINPAFLALGSPATVLGDFNGDGNLDMIVASQNASTGVVTLTDYLGNGDGSFTPGPIIDNNDFRQILVGDLTGNGILDLVVLGSNNMVTVYLGDGHGGLTKAGTLNLDTFIDPYDGLACGPADMTLGDFTGDGKLDLAVSNYFSNVVYIYEIDGNGDFGAPQAITVGNGPANLTSIPQAPFLGVGSFAVTGHGLSAGNVSTVAFAGESVIIPVLNDASNPDKVPLTISQVTAPEHGIAHITTGPSGSSGMVIVYAANPGYSGTDSFTYTIQDPAGVQSTGTITVTVSNTQAAPVITGNPSDYTVPPGQTATFTASASGNPTPTVQWQVSTDGGYSFSDISGATNATLTLNNATSDMDGYLYQAVFSNSFGTATTSVATLTVSSPSEPYITGNPSSQTVTAGQLVSFLASAGGSPTPLVQWQVSNDGGNTFNNISGATSTILTLTNVTTALTGHEYRAVFNNSAGTATSSAATLTVHVANGGGGGGGGGVLPPPFRPPTLHTPPLLAMIDGILGGIETVIPYESETVIDRFLGFTLFVSSYDSSGNLESVTFFGINVTFLFA